MVGFRTTAKFALFLSLLSFCYGKPHETTPRKTFIVHMDKSRMPAVFSDHHQWYESSLRSVSDPFHMLYSYNDVVSGFSARLTGEEARSLEGNHGVVAVTEDVKYELHTTRTPDFLGLGRADAVLPASESEGEVIVGVLDTGCWPESPSYDDRGFGPVPTTWKGTCQEGTNFNSSNCNLKLIGARFFSRGYEAAFGPIDESAESRSPRDDDGHGTHTSTTAAGSAVPDASLFGFATGTAKGMAPRARIAVYKVCWINGCFSSDIIAGIDRATSDGVDVLSMSIGGGLSDYYRDNVAIGTFAAMTRGILVSCSAGNGGPSKGSLSNVAPWITTVGAGTLDRDFPAYVVLGNGENYTGASLYSDKALAATLAPLVYGGNVSNSSTGALCFSGTLSSSQVSGKIVICDRGGNSRIQKGLTVKEAGGLGMIVANTALYGEELIADPHLLPSAGVGQKTGESIKSYVFNDPNPTATITSPVTELGIRPSPVVAAFSSRGPNMVTPEILKPDVIAPGVNILASWTHVAGPSGLSKDTRRVGFNIISGTSMSCPHVSGLAALVKAAHRDWSPAAVRSALMTTASTSYADGGPILDVATGRASTPFDYGAGHVNPVAALDPGLVYDLTVDDYLGFLCSLNYSAVQMRLVSGRNMTCGTYSLSDFNYPSFSVPLPTAVEGDMAGRVETRVYSRVLTNVGSPGTYKAMLTSVPDAVKVTVEPDTLTFGDNEKKSFSLRFEAASMASGSVKFARLEWSDGKHVVGSPIAFRWT